MPKDDDRPAPDPDRLGPAFLKRYTPRPGDAPPLVQGVALTKLSREELIAAYCWAMSLNAQKDAVIAELHRREFDRIMDARARGETT